MSHCIHPLSVNNCSYLLKQIINLKLLLICIKQEKYMTIFK